MLKTCPSCQSKAMEPSTTELTRKIGGVSFKAEVPVDRCSICDEWYVSHEDGHRFDVAVARGLSEHGIATPDAFKFMRKATGLRAVDLAELIGVTPETVSRWETGKVPVERRALALLQALVADHAEGTTATLDRLRALSSHGKRKRKRKPQAIRVAL